MTEIKILAEMYGGYSNPLQVAAAEFAAPLGFAEHEVSARYEDDQKKVIIVTRPECHCECGIATGERCSWSGPRSETVLVDYVPPYLRDTVRAAGTTRGCSERIRVHHECAELICASEPEWAEIVGSQGGIENENSNCSSR